MSAFARLCMRARARGAKRLVFVVDLVDPEVADGVLCGSWTVSVAGDPSPNGEEALRALVEGLEQPR